MAVVILLVVVGCGGGGADHDDPPRATPSPVGPSATPIEAATATPTADPSPSITASPEPASDEVVLGVATKYGATTPNGGRRVRQFVLRSEGGAWDAVPLAMLPADGGVSGVTFASERVAFVLDRFVPLTLVMDDGGTWQTAPITGVPAGWTVHDVLRLGGDRAVATATDISSGEVETRLLRSDDGGRSWRGDPTTFEHDWQIHDLARSSERR